LPTRTTSRARAILALQVGVPQRELQPEGHRLGVHAVGAPDHRRGPVLVGAPAEDAGQGVHAAEDQVAGLHQLQRERRVDHVRRGEAEVQPPGRGPHVLGHRRREGDDVVLRGLLDLVDSGDVEGAALADVGGGLGGHQALGGHRPGGGHLHAQPAVELPLLAPDGGHLGMGVAANHGQSLSPRPLSAAA
jgi:hypothetical protein